MPPRSVRDDVRSLQDLGVTHSQRAADLARQPYESGISTYLEVADANLATLFAQRISAQLTGQRPIASVQLIKSLGGGWKVADRL